MFLRIKIEQQDFKVSVGKGFSDWVWLAHCASRVYSKSIYPQGNYLPTVLYLQNVHTQREYHPHPKQKIGRYLQAYQMNPDQIRCVVKIRKANHPYSQLQRKWQKQAYQSEQYFLTFDFGYLAPGLTRKKGFHYKVKTHYTMADEVKHLFTQKQFPPQIITELHQKEKGQNEYQGTLKVPLGTVSHRVFYYQPDGLDEFVQSQVLVRKQKKDQLMVQQTPMYVSREQITRQVQKLMRIEEDINKTLQQKQLQTKRRNASSSMCSFSFQQLWQAIQTNYAEELSLQQYQKSTVERIKLCIQKALNQLYEIFFYYFILENQQRDRKEDLAVVYQDVMHFLKDYGLLLDLQDLNNFMEYYNADQSKFKRIEDTLDVNNRGVKFPQFVAIVLRSIQFVQTSTFLMKGLTFDAAATSTFEKIVRRDSEFSELTSFRLNIRQNPKMISFIRTSSQKLKAIFCWMFKSSIQSSSEMIVRKQEIKQLIFQFNLLQVSEGNSSSVDKIVNQCWRDLNLSEDGIFYYDYLVLIEWLAMALVKQQRQQSEDDQGQEGQATMIVEKIKYFISKIKI